MFIKLGKTNIEYSSSGVDQKYMIFSEIIDSSISYEKPILIRNESELNALFSTDFTDYEYLRHLLINYPSVGLYLYKPLSPIKSPGMLEKGDYISYEKFVKISDKDLYKNFQPKDPKYIKLFEEWKKADKMAIPVYKDDKNLSKGLMYVVYLGGNSFLPVTNPSSFFKGEPVSLSCLKYFKQIKDSDEVVITLGSINWVYVKDIEEFVAEEDLPQNISDFSDSKSLDNRSTLFIPKATNIDYCHPEYLTGKGFGVYKFPALPVISKEVIHTSQIREGRETLSLRLSSLRNSTIGAGALAWLELDKNSKKTGVLITTSQEIKKTDVFPEDLETTTIIIPETDPKKFSAKLSEQLIFKGYSIFWDEDDLIICGKVVIDLGYNTLSDKVKVQGDEDINQSLIYKSLESTEGVAIWSKTIGGTDSLDDDGIIKVRIEKILDDEDLYTVIITRYNFSETFRGRLGVRLGQDRLDKIVEKNSKLIHMKFQGSLSTLKTGTFELSRGEYVEKYPQQDWKNSLKLLFEDEKRALFDFFFVPDVSVYTTSKPSDLSYYEEYDTFLELSKSGDCQFLIQNSAKRPVIKVLGTDIKKAFLKGLDEYAVAGRIYYLGKSDDLEEYFRTGTTLRITDESRNIEYSKEKGAWSKDDIDINIVSFSNLCTDALVSVGSSSIFPVGTKFWFINRSEKTQRVILFSKIAEGRRPITKEISLEPGKNLIVEYQEGEGSTPKSWVERVKTEDDQSGYFIYENNTLRELTDLREISEAIYGGNFIHNYTWDDENRLVYFFESILQDETSYLYPGYSIFVDQIIMNGNLSGKTTGISSVLVENDSYQESTLGQRLEKYKCNFLSYNGHFYYYKKYFEGSKITSTFLRFILGKVARELYKEKDNLVGEKIVGRMNQLVNNILVKIKNTFKVVKHVTLTKFELDELSNSLDLTISTAVNNLVEHDITLNITLNLTK